MYNKNTTAQAGTCGPATRIAPSEPQDLQHGQVGKGVTTQWLPGCKARGAGEQKRTWKFLLPATSSCPCARLCSRSLHKPCASLWQHREMRECHWLVPLAALCLGGAAHGCARNLAWCSGLPTAVRDAIQCVCPPCLSIVELMLELQRLATCSWLAKSVLLASNHRPHRITPCLPASPQMLLSLCPCTLCSCASPHWNSSPADHQCAQAGLVWPPPAASS